MDPSDFPIGVEPTQGLALMSPLVLFVLVALIVLVLGGGYFFGRRRTEEAMWSAREGACASIHKLILDRARAAAAATRPQVMAGAQALSDEIHRLLGPVAALGAFGGLADRLKAALGADAGHGDHAHGDHGSHGGHDDHGHGGEHGGGHGGGALADDHGKAPKAGGIHINIGDITRGADHGAGHKPAHGKPGVDIDAIRKVVLDFTDYWSRPTMVAELMAAQKALVTPASKPKSKAVPNLSSSH